MDLTELFYMPKKKKLVTKKYLLLLTAVPINLCKALRHVICHLQPNKSFASVYCERNTTYNLS